MSPRTRLHPKLRVETYVGLIDLDARLIVKTTGRNRTPSCAIVFLWARPYREETAAEMQVRACGFHQGQRNVSWCASWPQ